MCIHIVAVVYSHILPLYLFPSQILRGEASGPGVDAARRQGCVCVYIYICKYIYIYIYVYTHVYIYIYREREREKL